MYVHCPSPHICTHVRPPPFSNTTQLTFKIRRSQAIQRKLQVPDGGDGGSWVGSAQAGCCLWPILELQLAALPLSDTPADDTPSPFPPSHPNPNNFC